VIANGEEILKLIPNLSISKLDKIEESIKLGQIFIEFELLQALDRHPNFADEGKKKYPKHLIFAKGGNNKMTDKGFYMFNIERSNKKLFLILVLVISVVIAFLLF
jgi:hypothetical protein